MIPEDGDEAARRIARIEARCFPRVMVWDPSTSVSGKWEALGSDWRIEDADPARFCARLERKLTGTAEAPAVASLPGATSGQEEGPRHVQ